MVNPADVVPKKSRQINGRKVWGGRGQEIDLISTDGKKYYWIEVSVSPSPYLVKGSDRFKDSINKFSEEKKNYLAKRFPGILFYKWFVYSPKGFPKKSDKKNDYRAALKKKGIEPISFDQILNDIYNKLNYMGYDVVRNYLFLLKKFNYGQTKIVK
jgi:hypothetical protein